ncbi:MAG: hypothetical protein CVT88_02810 [Candidatus Altiarchaeales archaeon HGW-Altiarchaeales-1]|nr:MAG: hypothetical protein CVT88_02810 [Candidatus Altiarchaeales archaeon HGW-Altiarchaeales-1]
MRKNLLLGIFGIFIVFAFIQISLGENITCDEGTYLKNNSCVHYEKVISISPSITEDIYAINGEDYLIGVTIFCNYPEDAKSKTKIGGYVTPSIEKIISLKPDLVFAHDLTDPDDIKLLQDANITIIRINISENFDGMYYNIRTIAKYLGKKNEGENLINNMKERTEEVKKTKKALIFSTPSVAEIAGINPLWVSGKNTFINDIIETSGGINTYSDINKWQPVSVETLIHRDPDIIIVSDPSPDIGYSFDYYGEVINNPNFKILKAVKNNNVYKINEDIISRDSPRVIDAMECVVGMIISYQYKNIPKYCENNADCTSGKCISSIHICLKLNDEICVFGKECKTEYCENGTCKEKSSEKISAGHGSSGGDGTSPAKYVYADSENKPLNAKENVFPPEIFNISEIFGLKQTLNLGGNFKDVEITIKVKNEARKFKSDENGDVTLTIPDYGSAEITISKSGFKNFTKTINVYIGTLNITKISGEKYGDEFKFKVTTKDGKSVQDAEVEIYGEKLKTDANGIVTKQIKIIQTGLDASTSANDYKGSSILFDVKAIGKLKIDVAEKVKQRDTITITVTGENKNPVPNAKVTINGVEQTANDNGKIEYKVTTTSLTLKAEKEGYIPSEQISVAAEKDNITENETYGETPNETKKDINKNYNDLFLYLFIALAVILIVFLKWRKK